MRRSALAVLLLAACTAESPDSAADAADVRDGGADTVSRDGAADAATDPTPNQDAVGDAVDADTTDAADAADVGDDAVEADATLDTAADAAPDISNDIEDAAFDVAVDAPADVLPDTADAGSGDLPALDALLSQLRAAPATAVAALSDEYGWPVVTADGALVVDLAPARPLVAGAFDDWAGTALTADAGFSWAVVPLTAGDGYKFTDGAAVWAADPWSRSYTYDDNGELSLFAPAGGHLERWFGVTNGDLPARRVRVWVPEAPVTHTLYAHDGQNLFDPFGPFGSWNLQASVPAGMMIVGIDNGGADRIYEYTPVEDNWVPGSETPSTGGGGGPRYAALVQEHVRPMIRDTYGEAPMVGVMGSSLGGLISLYIADAYPGEYDMAISLSGTLGWGRIGLMNDTMFQFYDALGSTAIYLDSGGGVTGECTSDDDDGINDDNPSNADNYCENRQFADYLASLGYAWEENLWHWHEPGAPHNETAWAARVFRPLELFAAR